MLDTKEAIGHQDAEFRKSILSLGTLFEVNYETMIKLLKHKGDKDIEYSFLIPFIQEHSLVLFTDTSLTDIDN